MKTSKTAPRLWPICAKSVLIKCFQVFSGIHFLFTSSSKYLTLFTIGNRRWQFFWKTQANSPAVRLSFNPNCNLPKVDDLEVKFSSTTHRQEHQDKNKLTCIQACSLLHVDCKLILPGISNSAKYRVQKNLQNYARLNVKIKRKLQLILKGDCL